MRTKPWPLVILAICHVFAPIANLLFCAYLMHITPAQYFSAFIHTESALSIFAFFCLLPIAGIAIFAIKAWSYPVYIPIMAWSFYSSFRAVHDHPEYFSAISMSLAFLTTFLVVSYFLIPAVRAAYFDPRLRWWESQPRYPVDLPVEVKFGSLSTQARITDVALGGIFISSEQNFEVAQPVRVRFFLGEHELVLEAKVVHKGLQNKRGYGLQFVETSEMREKIKSGIQNFKKQGLEPLQPRNGKLEIQSGISWFARAIKTGKGWVPELPASYFKKDRNS